VCGGVLAATTSCRGYIAQVGLLFLRCGLCMVVVVVVVVVDEARYIYSWAG
jgi:hypothetical protein